MSSEQLRKSILQMAIQGKILTTNPQSPLGKNASMFMSFNMLTTRSAKVLPKIW